MFSLVDPSVYEKLEKFCGFQSKIKWTALFSIAFFHIFGICWSYLYAFPVKWQSLIFYALMIIVNATAITCGVHRLWTHRSYKTTVPLRIYLMLAFSSTGQNSIYSWVRDHRLHHKYSDTDADPHNASRGFWFSHIGWLMMKKNQLVLEKGRQIDLSDIKQDPVAMFENRHTIPLSLITCYLLPTLTGIILWEESWKCAIAWQCCIRVLVVLHCEMTVNSFAHMFGYKPYNKNILPSQNLFVSVITYGEGSHNYHHTFPSDYKAAETFDLFNSSTLLIQFWSLLGLAYDLKEASPQLDQAVINKQQNIEKKS